MGQVQCFFCPGDGYASSMQAALEHHTKSLDARYAPNKIISTAGFSEMGCGIG